MAAELPDAPWASGASLPDAPWAAPLPEKPKEPEGPLSAMDVAKGAVVNAPSSALNFASDMVQPILHPIETATNIKNLGHGVLQKAGVMSGDENIKGADAVGQFFSDRYGGLENVKKTLATDPVGFLSDLSVVLSGGGTLAARAPGIAGKTAQIVQKTGNVIDPINATGKVLAPVAAKAGHLVSEVVGGLGTQTGGQSLRTAAEAGFEGGEAGKVFRENMRGTAPMEDTVIAAKDALNHMRQERGKVYRDQMKQIGLDQSVLDFQKIDDAFNNVASVKTYKGQSLSPSTTEVRKTLAETINEWKNLNPADFHTAEGLDALKQKIGDIRDGTKPGTPERVVAGQVYNAVRQTIINQAPEYAKVMKGYEEASNVIKDIEKTLSLNPKASVDTSLRKLQSVLRNNVNTSYGRRAELADYLVNAGAPHLMERLAGQSLNTWTARGLGKLGMQLGAELGLLGAGTAAVGAGAAGAAAAGALPFMSPRLMGEVAHAGGRGARHVGPYVPAAAKSLFQTGRESEEKAKGGRIKDTERFVKTLQRMK